MNSTSTTEAALLLEASPLVNLRYLAAAIAALAAMVGALLAPGVLLLDFIHIMFGLLWTGIDLFMGFVMGPILRKVSLDARRQIITRLMPRMLYLMTTLSIVTGTTGWYLAERIGRWMRIYVTTVAMQGVLQVAIIVVMARLRMG
ncbi:MAG: hypothetical protein ACKVQU_06955 [Burkholderiales bacterium]